MTEKTAFENAPSRVNWVTITNLLGVTVIVIIGALIYNALQNPDPLADNTFALPAHSISPQTAHDHILNNENAVLVEISTQPREAPRSYVEGAIPIVADEVSQQVPVLLPHHQADIMLLCFAIQLSTCQNVAVWLRENGYNNVMLVDGGLEAWQAARLPLVEPLMSAQ